MKLAAKYPSKKIEGVSFFGVTSWRDTGSLAIEANAQQGLLIVDLFKELKRLKANAPSRQLVRRVDKLEKKLNAMRDGGIASRLSWILKRPSFSMRKRFNWHPGKETDPDVSG